MGERIGIAYLAVDDDAVGQWPPCELDELVAGVALHDDRGGEL